MTKAWPPVAAEPVIDDKAKQRPNSGWVGSVTVICSGRADVRRRGVSRCGLVEAFAIGNEHPKQGAQLEQLMPVAVVACKARDLSGCDRANLAETDLRDHALEAGARGAAGRRTAEVLVDDLNLRPAKLREAVAHGVLKPLTLAVVMDLIG